MINVAAVATIASSITNAGNLFITSDIDWTNADTSGALRTVAWADGGANDICSTRTQLSLQIIVNFSTHHSLPMQHTFITSLRFLQHIFWLFH
jgi:hypothetical protein